MNASDQSSKIEKINKLQSRLLLAFSRYQIRAYFRAFMTRAHVSLSGRSGWKEAAGGTKSLRELPGARHTVPTRGFSSLSPSSRRFKNPPTKTH